MPVSFFEGDVGKEIGRGWKEQIIRERGTHKNKERREKDDIMAGGQMGGTRRGVRKKATVKVAGG